MCIFNIQFIFFGVSNHAWKYVLAELVSQWEKVAKIWMSQVALYPNLHIFQLIDNNVGQTKYLRKNQKKTTRRFLQQLFLNCAFFNTEVIACTGRSISCPNNHIIKKIQNFSVFRHYFVFEVYYIVIYENKNRQRVANNEFLMTFSLIISPDIIRKRQILDKPVGKRPISFVFNQVSNKNNKYFNSYKN